jgi:ABC-type transport system involved in cytochrome bd biosynthesis fused ATPase/permease subunit
MGTAADALGACLPAIAEAVARAALGEAFAAAEGADEEDDAEVLIHAEGLMLMYGAGHLLLKDTTLELKANHRYGVVAHNGAGKTTLMKEIAGRRVVGMSEKLSVVHVDDSNLTAMKSSTPRRWSTSRSTRAPTPRRRPSRAPTSRRRCSRP